MDITFLLNGETVALNRVAPTATLLDWLRERTWPYEASLDGDATQDAAELGVCELLPARSLLVAAPVALPGLGAALDQRRIIDFFAHRIPVPSSSIEAGTRLRPPVSR